jgi:hypothetical protein
VLLLASAASGVRVVWCEHRLDAELAELREDVGHLAVADVGHVLLERQPEHADLRALHRDVACDEQLDELLRDVGPMPSLMRRPARMTCGVVAELISALVVR